MSRVWLLLTLLLAGCSILPEAEELRIYQLPTSSLPGSATTAPHEGDVLRINRPQASPLLDSTRIVVMPQTHQLSAYQGVRWSDRAAVLLRDRVMERGRESGRFRAIISDDLPAPAELELAGELKAYQIEYRNGAPLALIRLQASLLRGGSRDVLASRAFVAEQAVDGTSIEAAVDALGRASDDLAHELMAWLEALKPERH